MNRTQHYRRAERLLNDCRMPLSAGEHYPEQAIPALLAALTHAVLATVDLDVELTLAVAEQKRPAT